MRNIIGSLRRYAEQDLHGTDLRGYAARDAAKVLLVNWEDAIADGNKDNLVADIDLVIDYLRQFQREARTNLPLVNGGLGGYAAEYWLDKLAEENISVYEVESGNPGYFSFTGSNANLFRSEEDAVVAAVCQCLDLQEKMKKEWREAVAAKETELSFDDWLMA